MYPRIYKLRLQIHLPFKGQNFSPQNCRQRIKKEMCEIIHQLKPIRHQIRSVEQALAQTDLGPKVHHLLAVWRGLGPLNLSWETDDEQMSPQAPSKSLAQSSTAVIPPGDHAFLWDSTESHKFYTPTPKINRHLHTKFCKSPEKSLIIDLLPSRKIAKVQLSIMKVLCLPQQ